MSNQMVLVVDDFVAMRDILVYQLKSMGITNVHTAGSGEDALRLLDLWPYTLILSDWSMPGMSGLELLQRVRSHPLLAQVPFVLVTAEVQRERLQAAIAARVDDFLLKPFRSEEFARRIGALLAGRGHAPVARPETAALPSPATGAPRILVVDDTPANLTLVSGLLRDAYQVKLAARGDKALQLCAASPPDLILLDLLMPEMDGFEVCRRLKANPDTAHIPVIFLTAVSDAERTVAGLELGAVDYVAKPIEPPILKARVAAALRMSRAHEALREQMDLALENARLRDEVERMMRHDLKNPLAAIAGMAARLLDEGGLPPAQLGQVQAIETAAHDTLDMLHLSNALYRIESGAPDFAVQQVDLAALLLRVATECRPLAAARGATIATSMASDAPQALGNPLLLYSMVHNLVKNAVEAVTEGQLVRIALDTAGVIRIHNPGAVADAVRGRFFDKYATHGKRDGSGIGTYSARLIARAHGGDILLETSVEAGTTLIITLGELTGS